MIKFGKYVRTGHVTKQEAYVSLNLVYMKLLQYTVPSLVLSKEDYKDISWPLLKNVLPKSGINRNIDRYLLYDNNKPQVLGYHVHIYFKA